MKYIIIGVGAIIVLFIAYFFKPITKVQLKHENTVDLTTDLGLIRGTREN